MAKPFVLRPLGSMARWVDLVEVPVDVTAEDGDLGCALRSALSDAAASVAIDTRRDAEAHEREDAPARAVASLRAGLEHLDALEADAVSACEVFWVGLARTDLVRQLALGEKRRQDSIGQEGNTERRDEAGAAWSAALDDLWGLDVDERYATLIADLSMYKANIFGISYEELPHYRALLHEAPDLLRFDIGLKIIETQLDAGTDPRADIEALVSLMPTCNAPTCGLHADALGTLDALSAFRFRTATTLRAAGQAALWRCAEAEGADGVRAVTVRTEGEEHDGRFVEAGPPDGFSACFLRALNETTLSQRPRGCLRFEPSP